MGTRVLVIGTGKMGIAHISVLKDLDPDAIGAWAPTSRAKKEVEKLGVYFFESNLLEAIKVFKPSHVIVAAPIEKLYETTSKIINLGVENILVEKPMVLNKKEAFQMLDVIEKNKTNLRVAYNRRYYSSFKTVVERIKNSKEKIQSVYFEFNENYPTCDGPANKDFEVKKRWILANSMHVIDLAFSQVGLPLYSESSFSFKAKDLNWHPSGSIFYGSGITENYVPFVYHANWNAPGNWKVEWMTSSTRYIFNPIERFKIMKKNSFKIEDINFDNSLDVKYKPGVFLQNKDFLRGDNSRLVSPEYAVKLLNLAEILGGYND
jgi:predicted dehydrogenase